MAEHELVHVEPPEFQDRIAEVKADMAQQFANLREMERNAELRLSKMLLSRPNRPRFLSALLPTKVAIAVASVQS